MRWLEISFRPEACGAMLAGGICADERALELVYWATLVVVNLPVGIDSEVDETII